MPMTVPAVPVDLSAYTGNVGEAIDITATDDHAVKGVRVKIKNGDGGLVEGGTAVQQAAPNQWLYTTMARNTSLGGNKITVSDTPLPATA
jgi:hypothetical protein